MPNWPEPGQRRFRIRVDSDSFWHWSFFFLVAALVGLALAVAVLSWSGWKAREIVGIALVLAGLIIGGEPWFFALGKAFVNESRFAWVTRRAILAIVVGAGLFLIGWAVLGSPAWLWNWIVKGL